MSPYRAYLTSGSGAWNLKYLRQEDTPGGISYLPVPDFPKTSVVKKKILIFASRQPFRAEDGLNQVAEKAPIPGPLAALGRGAFQPYFGKQGEIQAYFPREPKRAVLRGFPDRNLVKGARSGRIFPQGPYPLFPGTPPAPAFRSHDPPG